MKRLLVYVSIMIAGGVSPAMSQSPTASPEEVVRQFFEAEQEGRWLDAARLMDLKRFETLRRSTVRGLRTFRQPWRQTPEQIMQMDPEIPRAVAEYQASRANKAFADFNPLESQFARVTSADSLEALPLEEAAARWLEAQGPKWQEERVRKEAAKRPPMKCQLPPDSLTSRVAQFQPKAVVLGAAPQGDSVRYVVIGRSFGEDLRKRDFGEGMSPAVMTLVRVRGAWRIVPSTGEMINFTGFGGNTTFAVGCDLKPPAKDSTRKN